MGMSAPAAATTYVLAVSTTGPLSQSSVIVSTPTGISCPPTCSHGYSSGTIVSLYEMTVSTIAFAGWEGATTCTSNASTCTVSVPAAASTVTAHFDPTLTISISGDAIGVITSTNGFNCSSSGTCANGATVRQPMEDGSTVWLEESTGTASTFLGWTGGSGCGTASTCTFTLNGSAVVVATFTASSTIGVSSFTIKVAVPTGHGTVRSSPAGILCPPTCSSAFVAGGTVSFSTRPASGYYFAGWANGGCSGLDPCVATSSSPLQGLGGLRSPAAFFYPTGGTP